MIGLLNSFSKMKKYIYPRLFPWVTGGLADAAGLALYSVFAASAVEYLINAIAQKSLELMKAGFLRMAAAVIIMFIFEGYYRKFFDEALAYIKRSLCKDVFDTLLKRDVRDVGNTAASEQLAYLNRDVEKAVSLVGEKLLSFFRAAVMAIVSLAAIAYKSPGIGVLSAVLFAGVIGLNIFFASKHTLAEKRVLKAAGKYNNLYKGDFEGAMTIRTSGLDKMIDLLFFRQTVKYLKAKKMQRNLTLIQELSCGGLARLMAFGPVLVAISACAEGNMTVGSVFFIFQFAMNLVGYAGQLFDGFFGMGKAGAGVERLWAVFSDIPGEKSPGRPLDTIEFIEFNDVHIVRDGRQIPPKFQLCLHRGEMGVLAGRSGSGKSTCLNALMSFIHYEGKILVNGTDLNCIDQRAFYKNVSYVEQEPKLFAGTIYENICYGKPDAKYEDIVEAAQMACIADEIDAMPEKYDTPVGEDGQGLSGGQRQRIALARAFLRNSPVMIWDECTSAVDAETEAKICKNIQQLRKDKIIIMSAHREGIIHLADKVISVE